MDIEKTGSFFKIGEKTKFQFRILSTIFGNMIKQHDFLIFLNNCKKAHKIFTGITCGHAKFDVILCTTGAINNCLELDASWE